MDNSTEEKPPTEARNVTPAVTTHYSTVTLNTAHVATACAAGLLVCFFLPWIKLWFGSQASGFELAKAALKDADDGGMPLLYLWILPFCSLCTFLAGLAKQSQKNIGRFTGAFVYVCLVFALTKIGSDLMRFLDFGAYLTLLLGLILFIVSIRMK